MRAGTGDEIRKPHLARSNRDEGEKCVHHVSLMIAAGAAISAQDRYSLKVPNGLAFAQFRGYESWDVISVSHAGPLMAVIVGNPVMIDAYKAGIPGNGKPFPDGAKMAKIHWVAKANEVAPGKPRCWMSHNSEGSGLCVH
jgi:hypothetical protein